MIANILKSLESPDINWCFDHNTDKTIFAGEYNFEIDFTIDSKGATITEVEVYSDETDELVEITDVERTIILRKMNNQVFTDDEEETEPDADAIYEEWKDRLINQL